MESQSCFPTNSIMAVMRLRFSMFADTARVTNVRIIIIIIISD